jgi:hypothetical protein
MMLPLSAPCALGADEGRDWEVVTHTGMSCRHVFIYSSVRLQSAYYPLTPLLREPGAPFGLQD